jgi:hypothetical protein
MDLSYPAAWFQTPGAVTAFVVFVILELASVILAFVIMAEFRLLRRRHMAFFRDILGGEKADTEKSSSVVLWIYIHMTMFAVIITSVLFVMQPHLL